MTAVEDKTKIIYSYQKAYSDIVKEKATLVQEKADMKEALTLAVRLHCLHLAIFLLQQGESYLHVSLFLH